MRPKWAPGVVRQSKGPTTYHLMQRSCDRPSVIPSEVPEIIAPELEKPKSTFQPLEDHAARPEVPVTTEPADVHASSWIFERL